MDVVTRVELECSYGAGDGWTRSGVVSMPKERSGGPRLDRTCDWEKHGYDRPEEVQEQRECKSRGSVQVEEGWSSQRKVWSWTWKCPRPLVDLTEEAEQEQEQN